MGVQKAGGSWHSIMIPWFCKDLWLLESCCSWPPTMTYKGLIYDFIGFNPKTLAPHPIFYSFSNKNPVSLVYSCIPYNNIEIKGSFAYLATLATKYGKVYTQEHNLSGSSGCTVIKCASHRGLSCKHTPAACNSWFSHTTVATSKCIV